MKTKNITIEVPEGYEIDQKSSTFENIVFKEIKKDITKRVKSVEDACKELGEEDEAVMQLRLLQGITGLSSKITSEQEIVVVNKSLNEGWVPDWNNGEWDKWFVWMYLDESPRFCVSGNRASFSDTSSRLCTKTKELSLHAYSILEKQYKDYFTY